MAEPKVANGSGTVGEGPEYAAIREAARAMVSEWIPWGIEYSQNWWSAGICGVTREEDGTNVVHVETFGKEKRGLGVHWPVSMATLRASAISLLIYCEAYEPPAPENTTIMPARCLQPGDVLATGGRVLEVRPGAGKTVRVRTDDLDGWSVDHMDATVRIVARNEVRP